MRINSINIKPLVIKYNLLMIVFIFIIGCASNPNDPYQRYYRKVYITVENQCPQDITVLYKTLKLDNNLIHIMIFFNNEYDIIEEKTIVHSGQSTKLEVLHEESSRFTTHYYKAIEISYNDTTRAFNFEPDMTLIIRATDFNAKE